MADCHLSKPRLPLCHTPCGGSAVCVEDDVCQAYPKGLSAGSVKVTGIRTVSGSRNFTLVRTANWYRPPGGSPLDTTSPPFEPGDPVRFEASGDPSGVAAFSLSAKGVAPLALTSDELELATGEPLHVTWAAGSADVAQIHVKLDISSPGGSEGMIECDTADDGELDIPAELITDLLALGVAGYPTIRVTRQSTDSTKVAQGTIVLTISSQAEMAVTVSGLVFCTEDTDCPEGKNCQENLICSE
jgi:hypothetical protein